MLDEETRRKLMLQQEGQVLASAGTYGIPMACESARCLIDGATNALIRIDGAEKTAGFVFALSDRVAGGMRENTDYLSTILTHAQVDQAFDEVADAHAAATRTRRREVRIFTWGVLCGLAVMMAVTILAQGKV